MTEEAGQKLELALVFIEAAQKILAAMEKDIEKLDVELSDFEKRLKKPLGGSKDERQILE